MRQVREELHNQLGAFGQKYVMLVGGDREKAIDYSGVYLSEDGTMLGDKYFDVSTNDFVIVDGVKYTWFVRINIQKNFRRYYLYRK